MAPVITLNGIDQAIENLKYRNENSLKYKLVHHIRSFYNDDESLRKISSIESDKIIGSLWDTRDPGIIRNRRRNLSSIKSTVNADLKKLYDGEKNPEGITIGADNTFEMSEEAKDKALKKFQFGTEGVGQSLEDLIEILKAANDILSNSDQLNQVKDAENKDLVQFNELIRNIAHKVTGSEDGVKGDVSLVAGNAGEMSIEKLEGFEEESREEIKGDDSLQREFEEDEDGGWFGSDGDGDKEPEDALEMLEDGESLEESLAEADCDLEFETITTVEGDEGGYGSRKTGDIEKDETEGSDENGIGDQEGASEAEGANEASAPVEEIDDTVNLSDLIEEDDELEEIVDEFDDYEEINEEIDPDQDPEEILAEEDEGGLEDEHEGVIDETTNSLDLEEQELEHSEDQIIEDEVEEELIDDIEEEIESDESEEGIEEDILLDAEIGDPELSIDIVENDIDEEIEDDVHEEMVEEEEPEEELEDLELLEDTDAPEEDVTEEGPETVDSGTGYFGNGLSEGGSDNYQPGQDKGLETDLHFGDGDEPGIADSGLEAGARSGSKGGNKVELEESGSSEEQYEEEPVQGQEDLEEEFEDILVDDEPEKEIEDDLEDVGAGGEGEEIDALLETGDAADLTEDDAELEDEGFIADIDEEEDDWVGELEGEAIGEEGEDDEIRNLEEAEAVDDADAVDVVIEIDEPEEPEQEPDLYDLEEEDENGEIFNGDIENDNIEGGVKAEDEKGDGTEEGFLEEPLSDDEIEDSEFQDDLEDEIIEEEPEEVIVDDLEDEELLEDVADDTELIDDEEIAEEDLRDIDLLSREKERGDLDDDFGGEVDHEVDLEEELFVDNEQEEDTELVEEMDPYDEEIPEDLEDSIQGSDFEGEMLDSLDDSEGIDDESEITDGIDDSLEDTDLDVLKEDFDEPDYLEETGEGEETGAGQGFEGGSHFDSTPGEGNNNEARRLAEEFDSFLGAMDRHYNQYLLVPEGKYIVTNRDFNDSSRDEKITLLSDFYMGKFPVTNALFEIFVEKTGYRTSAEKRGYGTVYTGRYRKTIDPATKKEILIWDSALDCKTVDGACWHQPHGPGSSLHGKRNHPVVQITLEDAMAFSAWTGKRLPSEEEWEGAARTSKGSRYPWGNKWKDDKCNFEDSCIGDTSAVDKYTDSPNSLGIADTMGNVWEWTFDNNQRQLSINGKKTQDYILKGGAWISAKGIDLTIREKADSGMSSNIIGFRCVAF